jgi:hypothetical protein
MNLDALKDAVGKLKAAFTEQKFLKVLTSEGVEVTLDTEEVVVGAKATITSPEGTEVPAPEGEHVLEDGTIITVTGGEVVSVGPKVEEEEDMKDEEPKEDENIQKMSADIEANKTANAELLSRIAKLEEMLNSKFERQAKVEEKLSAMFKAVEVLSNIPSEEPIEVDHKFGKQNTKDSKLNDLATLLSKYKK